MARLRIIREAARLAKVTIFPSLAEVVVGQSMQFTLNGLDQYGSPFPVSGGTWASSNSALATVDQAGFATGVAVGEVDITYVKDGTVYA